MQLFAWLQHFLFYLVTGLAENSDYRLIFPWYHCDYSHVAVNTEYIKRHYHLQTKKNKTMTERLMFSYLQEYFYFKSVQSFMSTNK